MATPKTPAPIKAAASTPADVKNVAKPVPTIKSKPAAAKTVVKTAAIKPADTSSKKTEKAPKQKMERDSFTMPKAEYAQIYILKDRLIKLGQPAKKSELLRAGLMLLAGMDNEKLKETLKKVPAIKTGRPKK